MGFNVTALAQKARTQTLIVDSDLDMGQYDVIATDVKGDTAEFSEFVGGVGNFESGLISGGLDVGDILHAESSMQIDGDLVVEGAINNVNITNEGAISTAKSVTATGGFKGNVTGNVTGSISGGTVAGSTGTFSGVVTGSTGTFSGAVNGKNIPYNILSPLKIYISTSSTSPYTDAFIGIVTTSSQAVNTNGYYTIGGRTRVGANANSSKTIKFMPTRDENTLRIPLPYSGDISTTGNYSYYASIQPNTANTVKVTNNAGLNKTFNSSGGQYHTLTLAEVKSILTHLNTVTITNNTAQAYNYFHFEVVIKNNNSGYAYAYCSNEEYL